MVLTLLRTMLSSAAAATASTATASTATATATTAQWKWEVNHDGAILAYQGSSSPSGSSSAPSAPSGLQENGPRTRTSLVDYWYLVHDGVVIPTVNDP